MKATVTTNHDYLMLRVTNGDKHRVNLTIGRYGPKITTSSPVPKEVLGRIWKGFAKFYEAKGDETYAVKMNRLHKAAEAAADFTSFAQAVEAL